MGWTTPVLSTFEDGDIPTEANFRASILDNLVHLGRGARVFHSVAQAVSGTTALVFDSERWDTDGFHSVVSNTSRLAIPADAAGRYMVGGTFEYSGSPGSNVPVGIRLNGTTYIARVSGSASREEQVYTVYDFAVADYVEFIVTGTAVNVIAAGNYSPEFWIQGVGGT